MSAVPSMSFSEYVADGVHVDWLMRVEAKDLLKKRAAVKKLINALAGRKGEWLNKFQAAWGQADSEGDLVEKIAAFCLLEGVELDVSKGDFLVPKVPKPAPAVAPVGPEIRAMMAKLEEQGKMLAALSEKVSAAPGAANALVVPPLSRAALAQVGATANKPQWVCRSIAALREAMLGTPVEQKLMVCIKGEKEADFKEQLFFSDAEKADAEVWSVRSVAPIVGDAMVDDASALPASLAMVESLVLAQWALIYSAVTVYKESYVKGGDDKEDSEGATAGIWSMIVGGGWGDTTLAAEEIHKRIDKMSGRFTVKGGRLLYKPKDGGDKIDVTDPPNTACRECRKKGRGASKHWFIACPCFEA